MRISLELPDGPVEVVASLPDGVPLCQAMRQKGIPLNTRCGERGLCRACLVEVEGPDGWEPRQSCRLAAVDGMRVRVPASSLLAYEPQIQSGFLLGTPLARDPLFGGAGTGMAVDIGTTTIAVLAVDLASGREVGRAAAFNSQMALGDDVLTRISLCLNDEAMVEVLRSSVISTIASLAEEAAPGVDPAGWVLSGNTTMLHLALGVNPKGMGAVPFTPVFLDMQERTAAELGLPGSGKAAALPGCSAYVGADIVSGMAASGFLYDDEGSLFVDVGTNGEMVVRRGGRLIGCATAAGPAFEGSGLECGVRAGKGAVSHLAFDGDGLSVEVIGGSAAGRPIGICGSAYVDFLAQGAASGLVGPGGRLSPDGPGVQPSRYGREAVIAIGQGRRPLVVTEADIARLLQAKAAIAAGILTLLRRAGLRASELQRVVLAGGFGMHLNLANAQGCGLLPGIDPARVVLAGNTSLGGAFAALMDRGVLAEMGRASREVEVIELNQDPDFEDTYIDCLSLGD